ncbi:nucleoside transporter C-terminal domain-containing protein [Xenorhabdus sp. IM139775]|uniref:nucleoside transporter C-terminal domain-containing protein n=1 Tax=Xenorhabdus sp. IM139775 TaxID=3025876 RepID=UPI002359D60A|nr:nucleoside transporter C-terminal domain-containing protein [Xenorhabdus sp. IM139775]MDC9594673.1 nucleoside transporter C-terminal domain-containing protein [Xenorhabdus sp. IM139775]
MDILRSLLGVVILIFIGYLFSVNKKRINLRTVGAALFLQISLGAMMLYIPAGKWLINHVANGVNAVISYSSAGSAFIFARLLSPALEPSQVRFEQISFSDKRPASIIEAAAGGAMLGLKIAVGVATVVMTFVALIALINGFIGGFGAMFGWQGVSLQSLFGYLFSPLAYIMGVNWEHADLAGSLIGQKLAINEFVAYVNFSPYLNNPAVVLDTKTIAVISFALCGFANFGSIAVVVGAFIAVVPERTSEIALLGFRALLAATLSNLMSATIAGMFMRL